MVVFPTPGGPESRAALYPDPSSFPPPNLPNLDAVEQKADLEPTRFCRTSRREVSRFFCYLRVCPVLRCGVCASSAASGAACWRSSAPPAGRSHSSENVDGTCPPTGDRQRPPAGKGGRVQELRKRRMHREGPAPSGPSVQLESCCRWLWLFVPGPSLRGSGSGGTWSSPWRGRSSEPWG